MRPNRKALPVCDWSETPSQHLLRSWDSSFGKRFRLAFGVKTPIQWILRGGTLFLQTVSGLQDESPQAGVWLQR